MTDEEKRKVIAMNSHAVAVIKYNEAANRYECYIDGQLKAYTKDDHERGKREMQEIVEEKGYIVIFENEKGDNE